MKQNLQFLPLITVIILIGRLFKHVQTSTKSKWKKKLVYSTTFKENSQDALLLTWTVSIGSREMHTFLKVHMV